MKVKEQTLYWDKNTQYEQYISGQINKSRRTTHRTHKNHGLQWAHDWLKDELKLNWKTVLCIGARHEAEPLYWKKLGYETDAIDLIPSSYEGWRTCDMSKMHLDNYLKNKKYDLVYMHDALEHCLDLDGFITGLNLVCKKYFYSLCPYQCTPSAWDVASHPFMATHQADVWEYTESGKRILKKESKESCDQNIRECFSEFDIIKTNIGHKNRLIMSLVKKQV